MKKLAFLLAVISVNAAADQYVNGYTRSNGTYVEPYVRSSPNGTTADNYGSRSSSSSNYETRGLSVQVPSVSVPSVSVPSVGVPSVSAPSPFDR